MFFRSKFVKICQKNKTSSKGILSITMKHLLVHKIFLKKIGIKKEKLETIQNF
jgi:hypothetical protein